MTQDSYNENTPLAADNDDSGDEFDGLEVGAQQSKSNKTPVMILILLVFIGVAAFLTYYLFLVPGPEKPLEAPPVMADTPSPSPEVAAPVADNAVPAPVDLNAPPATPPVPADPNAVAAEALPTPPVDPNAPSAIPPVPETAAAAAAPTDTATSAPAAETTATSAVVPATPAETPSASQATPASPEVAAVAPAPETPAAAPVPVPTADQLKPIDPAAVVEKAETPIAVPTALPTNAPQAPDAKKVADTIDAVNDILGSDAAMIQKADAGLAKQVEVTPRAKQVIVVKRNYSASSPQAVVAAGDRVLQAGQYGDAAAIYDRQLKKNPSDPLALAGKALAQQKAGQINEAMDTYQRLLDLNPRDVEALTNYLGLLQKQDPTQALSRLQSLSQQYPENAAVAGQLAMAHAGMMDTPNALRQFQKAIALDPTNPIYPFNQGVLYDRLGTSDKARESYRSALVLAREYPERASGVPLETIRQRLGSLSD